jgi:heme A synthase
VIAAVLVAGLLLTWTPPPWSRRAATAAQSFGILGVLVGLFTIALGIGPRTMLDLTLNAALLLTLIAGLAITLRKP